MTVDRDASRDRDAVVAAASCEVANLLDLEAYGAGAGLPNTHVLTTCVPARELVVLALPGGTRVDGVSDHVAGQQHKLWTHQRDDAQQCKALRIDACRTVGFAARADPCTRIPSSLLPGIQPWLVPNAGK
jgi:hypothetical protein